MSSSSSSRAVILEKTKELVSSGSKELLAVMSDQQRADIRRMLRDLESTALAGKERMEKTDDPLFDEIFKKLEKVHKSAVHTTEAMLAYELLKILAEFGNAQVRFYLLCLCRVVIFYVFRFFRSLHHMSFSFNVPNAPRPPALVIA